MTYPDPKYARISINGFCADGLGEIGLQPPPEFATHTATRATLFGSAGRERIWQLNGQKGMEHSNYVYMPAPRALRSNARGTKYREANDPGDRNLARESEVQQRWWMGVGLLRAAVTSTPPGCILLMRHEIRSGSRQNSNVERHLRWRG
jgi:hypothetical protein